MLTLAPAAPVVNPAPSVDTVAPTDGITPAPNRGHHTYGCSHAPCPTPAVAETALADRLAHVADGNDPADYRPDWNDGDVTDGYTLGCDDAPTGPTLREEYEEAGQRFGLAGRLMDVAEAFPDATARDLMRGAHWFAEGQFHGFREFARKLGDDLGLDGKPIDRPESIPSRFELSFECGWHAGSTERFDREAEMKRYFDQLDAEHDYEMEEREVDAHNREAGG